MQLQLISIIATYPSYHNQLLQRDFQLQTMRKQLKL